MKQETITILTCIPVWACPEAPREQQNPIKEECPTCKKEMWVSEKKRFLREKDNMRCLCMLCTVKEFGTDIVPIDINKTH